MPSISVPVGAAITMGLADVGVGAATAGVIGTIGGTALTGAAIGAAGAAVTGGNIGKGALYGGLTGGALGGFGAAFPQTAAGLGIGTGGAAASGSFPDSIAVTPEIAGSNVGGYMSAAYPTVEEMSANYGSGALSSLNPVSANSATTSAATTASGSGGTSGLFSRSNVLGALNALGSMNRPTYKDMPGPSSVSGTLGPLYNAPLATSGTVNRTPTSPGALNYYNYGYGPEQSFYNNNSITFPVVDPVTGKVVMPSTSNTLRQALTPVLNPPMTGMKKGGPVKMASGGILGSTRNTLTPALFRKNSLATNILLPGYGQIQQGLDKPFSWETGLDALTGGISGMFGIGGNHNNTPLEDIQQAFQAGHPISDSDWAKAGLPPGGGPEWAQRNGYFDFGPSSFSVPFGSGVAPQGHAAGGKIAPSRAPQGALSGNTFDTKAGDHYVRGASGGQADDVNAKLSTGEFVFDSNTVSALGDGNNEAGAKKLDQMRRNIAKHKGFKKVIPPKAKAPERYLKRAS